MSQQKEAFAHFEICIDHLSNAWRTLNAIKEHAGHPLVGPAFHSALIEYCIPYTRGDGIAKPRNCLETHYVPEDFLELHKRILSSRHKVLAHTDLLLLDPKISWSVVNGQRLIARVQNNVSGLEELENLDSILKLIKGTLENMFAAREQFVLELEP